MGTGRPTRLWRDTRLICEPQSCAFNPTRITVLASGCPFILLSCPRRPLYRAGPRSSVRPDEGNFMSITVGSGEYRYRIIEDWAKLPDGWSFKEVAAVGVDKDDNVYCFNRGDHP